MVVGSESRHQPQGHGYSRLVSGMLMPSERGPGRSQVVQMVKLRRGEIGNWRGKELAQSTQPERKREEDRIVLTISQSSAD